jgi:hypothetical protein
MATAAERGGGLARHSAAWAGASPAGLLRWPGLGKYIRFAFAKFPCRLSRLHEDIGPSSFARRHAVLKDEGANPLQGHPVSKSQPEFPFKISGKCHHATPDTRTGSRITRIPLGFSPRRGIRRDGNWQAFYRHSARTQRGSTQWCTLPSLPMPAVSCCDARMDKR